MRGLALAVAAALTLYSGGAVFAQQAVVPVPAPLATTDASGAGTGSFVSLFSEAGPTGATALRLGCLVVNTSNTVAYVFVGAIASATTPKSIPLNAATADGSAGGSFSCERPNGGTLQSQISIRAASGETYLAIRY